MNHPLVPFPAPTGGASPEPKGDPLEYLSASRLKCFQTCRLQFYFRYVEKIPTVTCPALITGQVVHRVLQAWNLARWRGEDASVERSQLVFEACWGEECTQQEIVWELPDQETKGKAKAWSVLECYLRQTPIPLEEKPEAV